MKDDDPDWEDERPPTCSNHGEKCSIHITDDTGSLVVLDKPKTWATLKNAGEIRDHDVASSFVDPSLGYPKGIQYHRKCYQLFTLKRDLQKIETVKQREKAALNEKLSLARQCSHIPIDIDDEKPFSRSSAGETPVSSCMFCTRTKYKDRKIEPLRQCLSTHKEIERAARAYNDFKIIGVILEIGTKGYYHHSCYKDYIRLDRCPDEQQHDPKKHVAEIALEKIILHCDELSRCPTLIPYSALIKKVIDVFAENDVELDYSTKHNFRRRIEKVLPDFKFINIEDSLYVYPASLPLENVLTELVGLRKELEEHKKRDKEMEKLSLNEKEVVSAARFIRSEITSFKDTIPWPAQAEDLKPEKFEFPKALNLFFSTLFRGQNPYDKENDLSPRSIRVKLSLAQDIVYHVTNGRVKTPKSILFPCIVKSLTNNTELLDYIHLLGHGICQSLLMESLTDNAYQIYEKRERNGCVLPLETLRKLFTIFVGDNIDRNEETIDGYGTTHKVNNLLIQEYGPAKPEHLCNSPKRKRGRRSFKPILYEQKPLYVTGKRVGPGVLKFPENEMRHSMFADRQRDNFMWSLLRFKCSVNQTIPSWTGFYISIAGDVLFMQSSIQYLDCINAPATEITTIHQMMLKALSIMEALGLESIVCVFDQAIFSKACTIKWKEPKKFENCVLMMGIFHLLMVFMNILNKRFAGAGLRDTVLQSSIIAEGSVDSALRGKAYNRGVRLYKIVYEALMRLLMPYVEEIAGEHCKENLAKELASMDLTKITSEAYSALSLSEDFQKYMKAFSTLKSSWMEADNENTLRKFWLSYIDMTDLLLGTIYATRSGNWHLLLECIREIIPYAFAYDHINYARYLTAMLGEMLALPTEFPDIYEHFCSGKFAAQLTGNTGFSRVETDKVIEMTLNKDTKTPGGTTGFSTNVGAVQRWELNAPYRAALRGCFQEHLNYHPKSYKHKDLSASRIRRDEKDVNSVVSVLTDLFVNPFSEQTLISISTGIIPSEKVCNDLLKAKQIGKEAMDTFIVQRLGENATLCFFDTMKKLKLSTFANMNKVKVCKSKDKIIVLTSSTDIFSKVAIIAQKRSIELKPLFTYPLGAVPLSVCQPDGTLNKTAKSALLHKLEGTVPPLSSVAGEYTFIVDGMACVRQIKVAKMKYGQFAITLLRYIIGLSKTATRIDVVFDVYKDISIKDVERNRRSHGELKLSQIVSTADIKQWGQVLSSNENKNKLVSFVVTEWKNNLSILGQKKIFVTLDTDVLMLTSTTCVSVPALRSDHEEADTRMLLHAKHASLSFGKVMIYTPDTDVIIAGISVCSEIEAEMYVMTGKGNTRRIIDVAKIAEKANENLNRTRADEQTFQRALLGYHSFTGCDTTSCFSGRGKVRPLNIMASKERYLHTFASIGIEATVSDDIVQVLETFVCEMYGEKPRVNEDMNVDVVRYKMYCRKGGKISYDSLPPCRNVLIQHVKRSHYQTRIWRQCLTPYINPDDPTDQHGWCLNDGMIDIVWMTCNPAPDEVLELVSCTCNTCNGECPCIQLGFICTDACTCTNCENSEELPIYGEEDDNDNFVADPNNDFI